MLSEQTGFDVIGCTKTIVSELSDVITDYSENVSNQIVLSLRSDHEGNFLLDLKEAESRVFLTLFPELIIVAVSDLFFTGVFFKKCDQTKYFA